MNRTIKWYHSRGVWAGIVQALLGIAYASGFLTDAQLALITEHQEMLVGAVVAALGGTVIYTRATATKRVEGATNEVSPHQGESGHSSS